MQKDKKTAAQRASRRARLHHSTARVRNDDAVVAEEKAPEEELPVWYSPEETEKDEMVEAWMKDVRIPSLAEMGLDESGLSTSSEADSAKSSSVPTATADSPMVFTLSVPLMIRDMTPCRRGRLSVKRRKPYPNRWPFLRKRQKKSRRPSRSRRGVI